MSQSVPFPDNEVQRLQALSSYQVLDTLPELAFDDLTFLARTICHKPIALKCTHGICPFCQQDRLSQLKKA